MSRTLKTIIAALAFTTASHAANAATVDVRGAAVSGATDIEVVIADALAAAGLAADTWRNSRAGAAGDNPVYSFDVTRIREEADGNMRLFHWRSGLTISNGDDTATIKNFIINTDRKYITGKIVGDTKRRVLFRYGDEDLEGSDGRKLFMTMMMANGLNALLGTDLASKRTLLGAASTQWTMAQDDDSDDEGDGETSPGIVPVPATAALLLTGLGAGLAVRRRRHQA